ncbi:immunoglobulin domain-containing protein [Chitinophaga nivalis]|uniref:Ig-like domain-containing protein n=1 Tax=Chitinophaga nivalis TaxID=2991709 RepID=A0ABT3IMZ8_9BACT|nr:hypothetical protein [Chitinophaga nivalis]MCW3464967.1 hypothetical protein [Chitinophaga nivalis]MCW3485341.1 hypothetical protein [Chitinophaga nivalis]
MKQIPYVITRKYLFFLILFFLTNLITGKVFSQYIYATQQTNQVNGLCVLCGITAPDAPINNSDLDDYSTFTITAGLLGVSVEQTLIFSDLSNNGCDSLVIGIGSSNAVLSVNLFGGISTQTFNGTIPNNDLQTSISGSIRLLNNNTRAEISLKPGATFDRVKISLNSTLLGLLNSFRLYYAYKKPATNPPAISRDTAICPGKSVTLSASGGAGATISWYNALTGGTLLYTGNNFTVTPATTTSYYAAATTVSGCKSTRSKVTVTIIPPPENPVYTVPAAMTCGNTAITVSNYRPGLKYNIFVKYTGLSGLILDTTFSVTNTSSFIVPDINFETHVQANIGVQATDLQTGCQSDTTFAAFIYGGHSSVPTLNADSVSICKYDSTTLHAEYALPAIYRWYDAPTGGNLLFTGQDYRVSPAITTTYYVGLGYVCENKIRRAIKVIVKKTTNPLYTVPQGFQCKSPVITITNHQPSYYYKVRVIGLFFMGAPYDTSYLVKNSNKVILPALTFQAPVSINLYIQALDTITGCRSDSVLKQFTMGGFAGYPGASFDSTTICKGDSVVINGFFPNRPLAVIRWYDAPVNGNLLFTGNNFKAKPTATKTYYISAGFECEYPVRRPVKVKVNNCVTKTSHNRQPAAARSNARIHLSTNPTPDLRQVKTNTNKRK